MPKYLISATAFPESPENAGAYSPKSYSFVADLSEPVSLDDRVAVTDLAFREYHRMTDVWLKQRPQIDSVHEVVPAAHTEALRAIRDLVLGAEQNDVWDHLNIGDFADIIPEDIFDETEESDESGKTEKPEAGEDFGDFI